MTYYWTLQESIISQYRTLSRPIIVVTSQNVRWEGFFVNKCRKVRKWWKITSSNSGIDIFQRKSIKFPVIWYIFRLNWCNIHAIATDLVFGNATLLFQVVDSLENNASGLFHYFLIHSYIIQMKCWGAANYIINVI